MLRPATRPKVLFICICPICVSVNIPVREGKRPVLLPYVKTLNDDTRWPRLLLLAHLSLLIDTLSHQNTSSRFTFDI